MPSTPASSNDTATLRLAMELGLGLGLGLGIPLLLLAGALAVMMMRRRRVPLQHSNAESHHNYGAPTPNQMDYRHPNGQSAAAYRGGTHTVYEAPSKDPYVVYEAPSRVIGAELDSGINK